MTHRGPFQPRTFCGSVWALIPLVSIPGAIEGDTVGGSDRPGYGLHLSCGAVRSPEGGMGPHNLLVGFPCPFAGGVQGWPRFAL